MFVAFVKRRFRGNRNLKSVVGLVRFVFIEVFQNPVIRSIFFIILGAFVYL